MIVVLDNGQGYSMHTVWFVDVPESLADQFCAAIEAYAKRDGIDSRDEVTRVVARGSLDWWNGKPLTLAEFVNGVDDASHDTGCGFWQYDDETSCVCWVKTIKELAKGESR